jgi:CRISPR-associated protein Cmr6
VFLDALPLRWPELEVDVITRHHDPEALPAQVTPLDADKPNPVHFLTVAPGQVFVFRLLPCRGAPTDAIEPAWSWLVNALDILGAGAKTAVGYGQMEAVGRSPR